MIEKCPKGSGLLTRDYENELTCSLCAWHENGIGFYEWSHHKSVIIDKVFIPFTGNSRPVSSVKRIQPSEKLENLFLPVISKTRTICDPKQNPECKICRPHMITKNIDEKKTKKKSKKKVDKPVLGDSDDDSRVKLSLVYNIKNLIVILSFNLLDNV